MSSMIVELANAVNSQDGNREEPTYQRTLLPAPAIMGRNYQSLQSVEVGGLTFPINP
jgi:hypothetical protein